MLLRAIPMIAGHAGAWLLAAALAARLRTGSRGTDATALVLLHLIIVSLLVLATGTMGALNVWGLTAAGLAAGAVGAALGGLHALRDGWQGTRDIIRQARVESPTVFWMTTGLLAAVGLRHAFNIWFFVPATLDGNEYHLPRLACWIQNGDLQRPFMLEQRTYFPAGMQLVQAWWVGFLHHDVVIEAASTEFAALGGIATAAVSRKFGLPRPASLLAAALWVSTPAALLQGACELNDVATAGCVLAAFALVTRPDNKPACVAGAIAALALGTGIKPTAAFAAPGVIWLGILGAKGGGAKPAAGHIALVALAIFVGSYWYLINAVQFGNPLYPVSGSAASTRVGAGTSTVAVKPTASRFATNVAHMYGLRMTSIGSEIDPGLNHATGWGWPVTLFGLPAIVGFFVRQWRAKRTREAAMGAAFVLSALAVAALVEDDAWNARFIIWVAAPVAIAVAAASVEILPVASASLLVIGGAVNLVQYTVPPIRYIDGSRWAALRLAASTPVAERSAAMLVFKLLPPEERLHAERGEPVVCMTMNYPSYALCGPGLDRRVEYVVTDDAAILIDEMKRRKCPLLLIVDAPPAAIRAVEDATARGGIFPIAPGWFRLAE